MQPVMRARLLAAFAGIAGLVLAILGQWGGALGLVVLAAAILLLVADRQTPPELPEAAVLGNQSALAALARSLRLEGHAIVLPGSPSRLLVPARMTSPGEVPADLSGDALQREAGSAIGLLLPPPAAGLEAALAKSGGSPAGLGAEEAADHVRRAFADLGLGTRVVVARSPTAIRVTYAPLAFGDACRASREEHAPWHVQGGCPACSLAAVLVAQALRAPVRIRDSGTDADRVFVELELPRPPSEEETS